MDNIFTQELVRNPSLQGNGAPNYAMGIPMSSMMFESGASINNLSSIKQIAQGSIPYQAFGTLNANIINGGTISGVTLSIGSHFTVNSGGTLTATDLVFNGGSITLGTNFSVK